MEWSTPHRYGPAMALAALVLVASLLPAPETGAPTTHLLGVAADKWVHAGSYGALTVLLARGRENRSVAAVAVLVALAVGYGVGIELLQTLVPSRSLSGADMVANAVGAVLGALSWAAVGAGSTRAK